MAGDAWGGAWGESWGGSWGFESVIASLRPSGIGLPDETPAERRSRKKLVLSELESLLTKIEAREPQVDLPTQEELAELKLFQLQMELERAQARWHTLLLMEDDIILALLC
jgi:hypothetical protein